PVGLPRISLQTPADAGALFEETINFVRTGQMDLRVAHTIGYLTNGWLYSFQLRYRVVREAVQDEAKTAEKEARKEAQAAQAAKKAAAAAESANGSVCRDRYGRKMKTLEGTEVRYRYYGENGGVDTYRITRNGMEFVSSTRKYPPFPN